MTDILINRDKERLEQEFALRDEFFKEMGIVKEGNTFVNTQTIDVEPYIEYVKFLRECPPLPDGMIERASHCIPPLIERAIKSDLRKFGMRPGLSTDPLATCSYAEFDKAYILQAERDYPMLFV